MATPDELRTAIAEGREALKSAISAAASKWEQKPAEGEGEDAWSPRQVAEHAIPTETFFATLVCQACGYPGVKWEGSKEFATADEALAALEKATEIANGRLKYVTDTDLPKQKDEKGATAEALMVMNANHLNEHAAQIRAAAGV